MKILKLRFFSGFLGQPKILETFKTAIEIFLTNNLNFKTVVDIIWLFKIALEIFFVKKKFKMAVLPHKNNILKWQLRLIWKKLKFKNDS